MAQHGARHVRRMSPQETLFGCRRSIAHFTQHPADCLVYQVVGIEQENFGDAQGIAVFALPNEGGGRDDRDAPVPEIARARESVEDGPVRRQQVMSENMGRRRIDQVPVVDPPPAREIELRQRAPASRMSVLAGMRAPRLRPAASPLPWRRVQPGGAALARSGRLTRAIRPPPSRASSSRLPP